MTKSSNSIPVRLQDWQTRSGLTPAGLANLLGVPVNTYVKWLKGERRPDAAALRLIEVIETLQALAPDLLAALAHQSDATKG